ncbi:MAG: Holliday junction branch migration protein RuvA [Francisellaceae bacterium]
MISRIRGTLIEKQAPIAIIEAHGIGYEILVPMSSFYRLGNLNSEVILYTHFIVREDIQQLYGFSNKADRRLFQELIKVNGIGAKMALAILSGMDGRMLVHCVESQDHSLLCSIPGIGKKTAERLIVEIKDKLDKIILEIDSFTHESLDKTQENRASETTEKDTINPPITTQTMTQEAIAALEALGYRPADASKYVLKIKNQANSVEDMIRLALKNTQNKQY